MPLAVWPHGFPATGAAVGLSRLPPAPTRCRAPLPPAPVRNDTGRA